MESEESHTDREEEAMPSSEGPDCVDIPFSEFKARADAADIPINVVDHALVYNYVNPVLAGIFGYEGPQEIVRNSALLNITMAEAVPENMMETIHDTGLQSDKMVLRPDGEVRKLSGSYIAVRDEGDAPVEFAGFDEDLTEKKRKEELFEKLAEFTYEWIIWLSPEGDITYASPSSERITGYRHTEWTSGGVTWEDIVEPTDLSLLKQGVDMALRRKIGTVEFRIHTQGGETLWMEMASIPVFGAAGDFIGSRVSLRDVTERKNLQDKLLRSERLATLGEVAGSVGHELRSPLAVIKSSAFFLDEKLSPCDEKVKRHLERMERSVERADRTINDLLAFSRITPLEAKPTDLLELLRWVVTEMRLPPEMQVRVEADEGLPLAFIDPVQMEQVLHNLLLNAFQAMPQGGEVEARLVKAEDRLTLIVSDRGCGIAPDDLSRVFEPLFSTRAEGTGFGLAVCRRIVEEHGGAISIESTQGEGTTVTVTILAAG